MSLLGRSPRTVTGRTDDVADTIDYSALCAMAERIIAEERFDLLEALARRLAEAVMVEERLPTTRMVSGRPFLTASVTFGSTLSVLSR